MPITPQTIKVEITPKGDRPVLYFAQYDNGRPFICELYWEGEAYEPTDDVIELHVRKVDGNLVSIEPDSVTANSVQFFTTEQLCACFGKNIGTLVLKAGDDDVIASKDIDIIVQRDVFQGGIQSDSAISNLTTQIEQITEQVIGENYYDKTEVNNLLNDKADSNDVYTKTEVNNLLNDKADADDVYTKDETDTKISAIIDDLHTVNNKTWSSQKISDEIINILPTGTASGSIANFNTSLALPLVSVTSDDISASKVTRCGVNMWDEQYELGTFAFSNGTLVPANDRIRNKNKIRVLPNKKYYIVAPARTAIGYYDENDNYLGYDDQKQNSVITTKANTAYIYFFCLVTTYSNNISINCIETDTNYHAYNGVVKPIAEANEIVTLVGTNNIYADSGDIEVTYKKSIDDAIAELQALILS